MLRSSGGSPANEKPDNSTVPSVVGAVRINAGSE